MSVVDFVEEKRVVAQSMMSHGGSFFRALGEALLHADVQNAAKIRDTWPQEWRRYKDMAQAATMEEKARQIIEELPEEEAQELVDEYRRVVVREEVDWHGVAIALRRRGYL